MFKKAGALGLLVIVHAGCGTIADTWTPSAPERTPGLTSLADRAPQLRSNHDVLAYISELSGSDAAERHKLFDASARAFQINPTPSNELRLGIFLSSPHLLAYDAPKNRQILTRLLESRPRLPDGLSDMVQLRVRDLDHHVRVERENMALRQEVAKLKLTLDMRVAQNRNEVGNLKTELGAAQAKLRALTSIEESIERNDNKPHTSRD